ncbi:peptidase M60-like family-domain-containing protein [Aspergillus pseudotamarii]|uniref:Peptidase M60-like family-domain-containing protein n=1 Tax=Aspergillus pseudotamarii TaxID=132259 RepID=A0A5N6TA05_ASPPS|nr:peptidase M60-like family-domain-containing protein [Aspergillus pseudotamarii]KAE8143185.1 peptidase M60-like family-domain-containing protein [Aspergillus pseudotamarii]
MYWSSLLFAAESAALGLKASFWDPEPLAGPGVSRPSEIIKSWFAPWGDSESVPESGRHDTGLNAIPAQQSNPWHRDTQQVIPISREAESLEKAEGNITLKVDQDFQVIYPGQTQYVWAIVETCDEPAYGSEYLVLESSDLSVWNLSIAEDIAGCYEIHDGGTKIRCQWMDFYPGTSMPVRLPLRLGEYTGPEIKFNLTLTSYNYGEAPEVKTAPVHWHKRDLLTYVQNDASEFPQPRSITVRCLPKSDDEQARLKQHFKWADFQPTGFYLNPNVSLDITVSGPLFGSQPQLMVGTPALVHPDYHSEDMPGGLRELQPLRNGHNFVSDPLGGILYIRYSHPAFVNIPPVTVTLGKGSAVQPFPFFQEGITRPAQWKAMLDATTVPFAEVSGARVILTGLAADVKHHADRGQDQMQLLDTYKRIIKAQDTISGLRLPAWSPRDKPSLLRPMVVQTRGHIDPNSYNFRAAIPHERSGEMWWQPALRQSWMVWHELGHHRQHTNTWSWGAQGEVTVNIYSLAAQRTFFNETRYDRPIKEWNNAKAYLSQSGDKDFDTAPVYTKLVMFEQLRVVFGDRFFHLLHMSSRRALDQRSDADMKHYFMTKAAQIARKNLTNYFVKWGLKPEYRTVQQMKKQPEPSDDYTTWPVYGGS